MNIDDFNEKIEIGIIDYSDLKDKADFLDFIFEKFGVDKMRELEKELS